MDGITAAAGRGMALREEAELTRPQLIKLDYFAAPAALHPYVTTLFHFSCDEPKIRDMQPAAVGFLYFFLHGKGLMHFASGITDPSHPVSLLTPSAVAVPFEVDGPFHCMGAALLPRGWAAFTGLNADEHGNRLYDAAEWIGPEVLTLGTRLRAAYASGAMSPEEMCAEIADFIAARLRPINPRHDALMTRITGWLSSSLDPPLSALVDGSGYSERQLQRLVERYYGLTPKQLVRKYRALRVAALLQSPDTSKEQIAAMLNLFYDQSHLIREIRLFAGRTPARLGDSEQPILDALLDIRNFRQITPGLAAPPKP
jgi:AraC-like DNA-binding protein